MALANTNNFSGSSPGKGRLKVPTCTLLTINKPRNEKTNVLVRNPTWSDTNQAVQLQKIARCLKFWIHKVEELYYPCSENKGADLRLCFRICIMLVFSRCDSNVDLQPHPRHGPLYPMLLHESRPYIVVMVQV